MKTNMIYGVKILEPELIKFSVITPPKISLLCRLNLKILIKFIVCMVLGILFAVWSPVIFIKCVIYASISFVVSFLFVSVLLRGR